MMVDTEQITDGVWFCATDGVEADQVRIALEKEFEERLIVGPTLPPGAMVGLVIADEAYISIFEQAKQANAGLMQSVLLNSEEFDNTAADFVLPLNAGVNSIRSVIDAARDFREQVLRMKPDVAKRTSAIGTIQSGNFAFRTLSEARNLATMLALACPNSDVVAVGLQELMINAVEHGNLEIDAELKQKLILANRWREEVDRRLKDPEFSSREVNVGFQRGTRMISITIQDEGFGFDHMHLSESEMPTEGYRGRGIALARDLSFSSVAYFGAGNMVEATIMLDESDE